LLFDVTDDDIGIVNKPLVAHLFDISAVELFIDADQLHLVPLRIRMQEREAMERPGFVEQRGRQTEEGAGQKNQDRSNETGSSGWVHGKHNGSLSGRLRLTRNKEEGLAMSERAHRS